MKKQPKNNVNVVAVLVSEDEDWESILANLDVEDFEKALELLPVIIRTAEGYPFFRGVLRVEFNGHDGLWATSDYYRFEIADHEAKRISAKRWSSFTREMENIAW